MSDVKAGSAAIPATLSLADVNAAVEASPDVNPRQVREITSALNVLAKWLGRPLEQIPAAPEVLRRRLGTLHPENIGVAKARLANVLSLVNKALTLAGVKATNRPVAEALSPQWQAAMAGLIGRYLRTSLSPFARFCSSHGIPPRGVSDSVGRRYLQYLEQTALVKKPRTTHQTVCRTWNKARAIAPGWSDFTQLEVPIYRQGYSLPWDAFPQSLRDEIEVYLNRLSFADTADFLDESAPIRRLRPQSIKTKRYQLRQFASALVLQGVSISSLTSLAILASPRHFKTGLTFFLNRPRKDQDNPRSVSFIAHTIRSVAKYWVGLPKDEFAPMNNITNRLTFRQPGMTEKNRNLLNQFEDAATVAKFLNFPFEGLDRLLDNRKLSRRDAIEAQIYIALLILIHAPIRIKNLAGLRFEEHVILPFQSKVGKTIITIPSGQVKNRQPLMFILPDEVTACLVKYRKLVKPLLETEVTPDLFPNGRGAQKRSDTLGKQLSSLIWNKLGIKFNPHLIRHLTAKINIDARPGNYDGPRRLLGHASQETTYNSYEGLETKSASLLHDDIIQGLRRYVPLLAGRRRTKPERGDPKAGAPRARAGRRGKKSVSRAAPARRKRRNGGA